MLLTVIPASHLKPLNWDFTLNQYWTLEPCVLEHWQSTWVSEPSVIITPWTKYFIKILKLFKTMKFCFKGMERKRIIQLKWSQIDYLGMDYISSRVCFARHERQLTSHYNCPKGASNFTCCTFTWVIWSITIEIYTVNQGQIAQLRGTKAKEFWLDMSSLLHLPPVEICSRNLTDIFMSQNMEGPWTMILAYSHSTQRSYH